MGTNGQLSGVLEEERRSSARSSCRSRFAEAKGTHFWQSVEARQQIGTDRCGWHWRCGRTKRAEHQPKSKAKGQTDRGKKRRMYATGHFRGSRKAIPTAAWRAL